MEKEKFTVLIVDDASFMRKLIKDNLEKEGYQIIGEAETAKETVDKYFELKPHIVTMDLCLKDGSTAGLEATKAILEKDKNANIIVISGTLEEETKKEFIDIGITDFVFKPFQPAYVFEKMDAIVEKYNSTTTKTVKTEITEAERLANKFNKYSKTSTTKKGTMINNKDEHEPNPVNQGIKPKATEIKIIEKELEKDQQASATYMNLPDFRNNLKNENNYEDDYENDEYDENSEDDNSRNGKRGLFGKIFK